MKIGIYGGSFNPPHLGHFQAAHTAARVLELDKLLIIPAADPPHKVMPQGTPEGKHRLEMARRMTDALLLPKVAQVSDMELARPGKSYTADTLRRIREQWPQAELWLLMGTDMFLTLHLWREPEVIMSLAGICAFGRTEQDGEALFAPQRDYLQKTYNANIVTIELPGLVDISSTQLREQLAAGEGQKFLLPSVYGYILMNRLYGTNADLKQLDLPELRACSHSVMQGHKRVPHITGTEEEAARLAKRWGADERLARRAAILHDCTKYWSLEEHLALCDRYGVELDPLERRAVKLLHAKSGACMARHVFGEPDEVYSAIFWHTTGKGDMTLLDKIIYMADYIEPNRDFDGVEQLRAAAYEDLDRAVRMGAESTIREMEARGVPIHANTLAARDWLKDKALSGEEG